LWTRPLTGDGFEVGVGRGVGWAVGWAVGCAVGRGVGPSGGGAVPVEPGVGVGTTATIGASVGAAELGGSADGSTEGRTDGSVEGSTVEADGPAPADVPLGDGSVDWDGVSGSDEGAGLPGITAIPPSGPVGVTKPAVSATVARIRFRSPMATTRRAR
jgi:hypothetical protein